MTLTLDVVTPTGTVLSTEAEYIGVPGVSGQFGIMPGHIPLLSAFAIGNIYYRIGNVRKDLFVSGGFIKVSENKVIVLAESAEKQEDIDIERAKRAKQRAEERLAKAQSDNTINAKRAHAALARALMRLSIASGR